MREPTDVGEIDGCPWYSQVRVGRWLRPNNELLSAAFVVLLKRSMEA
jgi:hypothetical protein